MIGELSLCLWSLTLCVGSQREIFKAHFKGRNNYKAMVDEEKNHVYKNQKDKTIL